MIMKIKILMLYQDDPRKCTAEKLIKFDMARKIKNIGNGDLVLDPFADTILTNRDRLKSRSIVGIDCSWNLNEHSFPRRFGKLSRKLPHLLAGNPINYAKRDKLSTVEALSAALFILGFNDQAFSLLDKFKWGHTFYELNRYLLKDYSKAETSSDIESISDDYLQVR